MDISSLITVPIIATTLLAAAFGLLGLVMSIAMASPSYDAKAPHAKFLTAIITSGIDFNDETALDLGVSRQGL